MFPDALLPNLLLFAVGQAAAWYYLRTGRLLAGGLATALLWIGADWALIERFVHGGARPEYAIALGVLQGTALLTMAALAFALWRRRWSAAARARPARFGAGLAAYLRGDLPAAVRSFRALVRTDPWDGAAWLALGNALRRVRQPARAARCWRRALRVDRRGELAGFARLQLESRRAGRGRVVAGPAVSAATAPPAATRSRQA
ncbi:MAG: hypothetical protein FJ265_14990 [Planctomycetes bacterium]|nr:hypothetical protein [Planctomycetota bacterium]